MSALTDPVYLAAKAAVASAAAALLARALGVPDALSSSFVALLCVSPTAWAGLRRGAEQLGGACVAGAVTAFTLALWPWSREGASAAALVGVTAGATAWACHRLRWSGGHAVAGFTTLYLVLMPFQSLSEALRVRVAAVLVGAASATAVNLAVSAVAARAIRTRRMRVAAAAVAAPLERTAAACLAPSQRAAAADAWGPAFDAARELRADLDAQSREVLLPGRAAVRDEARRALAFADALADVAHLGRHVALVLEESHATDAPLAEALARAAASLARAEPLRDARAALDDAAQRTPDAALAAAARRMSRALADCEA